MATNSCSPAAGELLAKYPHAVQALARGAGQLIRKLMPGVNEGADQAAGLLAYGYGPGYRGTVCTLILSKTGVKIGLVRGAELDDPHGLLQGTGKVHKYVAVSRPADLRQQGVSALIAATYAAWQERTAASPRRARR